MVTTGWEWEVDDQPLLDEGMYPAVVTKLEPSDGQYGPQLKWYFDVEHGDESVEVTAFGSNRKEGKLGRKTKLREWAEAILGRPLQQGERLRSDDLLNKPCRVKITIVDTEKGEFNKVEKVLPARGASRRNKLGDYFGEDQ